MKNQRGFSLVQIIISLGLLSGLFVAALKIIQNQTELGKSSSYRFESLVIMDEVKSILSDPVSCRETLQNLSGIYDEVSVIKAYDPRAKKSEVIYGTFAAVPKVLGQNNLYVQSINLNGEIQGFSNENGHTSMVMTFSEKEKGGEIFKTTFPIKVTLNELGRIVDCQARPGIHQEKSSRTLNDPWSKMKNEEGNIIGVTYSEGPITIGQVPELGALNIEGGLLLYEYGGAGDCTEEMIGTLAFDIKRQTLLLCKRGGVWQPLHGLSSLGQYKKDYSLKTSQNEPQVVTTEEGFYVCRIVTSQSEAGQCSASPVNRLEELPKWELLSQNYRGRETRCNFLCFR